MCSLANLPDNRRWHTQSGLTACGGGYSSKTSCVTFSSGRWIYSHTLKYEREDHSSWLSPQGVLLMGGEYSPSTTEILTDDGQTTELFALKYGTRLVYFRHSEVTD